IISVKSAMGTQFTQPEFVILQIVIDILLHASMYARRGRNPASQGIKLLSINSFRIHLFLDALNSILCLLDHVVPRPADFTLIKSSGLVLACCRNQFAVRAEHRASERIRMSPKNRKTFPRFGIPQSRAQVGAHTDQALAIWAENSTVDTTGVTV